MKPQAQVLTLVFAACASVVPTINGQKGQPSQPLVERLEVVGIRRLTVDDILSHVKTRPGEPFSWGQCASDLKELLATGLFDKLKTRVESEAGVRGGVSVIFEVVELPLLVDIKVTNLRGLTESAVLQRFRQKDVNLVKGGVLDMAKVTAAQRILKELLESRGWPNTTITLQWEVPSSMYCSLTFNVTYKE